MSLTPSMGVVTPEAVVLEFRTGGLATRTLAKVIDLLIQAVVLILWIGLLGVSQQLGTTLGKIGLALGIFFIILILPALVETMRNGRTPGKAILGLRVVTTDGGPIAFRHAILRCFIQLVEIPLGVAVFIALANRRSQRLGDLAAGTFVISERAAVGYMVPTAFLPPPGTEEYCFVLDVSRVDSEQFLLVRNFLLRVSEMDRTARDSMANRLAVSLSALTAPPAPTGMPAEIFLICVCSAYQLRHGGLPAAAGTALAARSAAVAGTSAAHR